MAKPVITDKPIIDQAEFNGVTIWRKEGGSIEVSDTNYPSMKTAIQDIAAKAGVTLQDDWNTQYAGWYLIQQLKQTTVDCKTIAGPELVDLGLSVKWASCNLGATKPEEYGRYFAWGDIKGQTWDGSNLSKEGFGETPEYKVDENNNLISEYDAAHVILGGSYRMPTKDECEELLDNCESAWTDDYNGTGVKGRLFTSKKNGKSIFFPTAGQGYCRGLILAGSGGYYWSSTVGTDDAWFLYFFSDTVRATDDDRYYGRSIRPVSE